MSRHSAAKAALEEMLLELNQRAAEIEARLSDPGSRDWEENATESEDDEVLARMGDVTKHEIREIHLALSRIENGNYETCTSCGDAIAPDRLRALPYATTCIKCA
jgi:DnaK suppressor protein